MIGTLLVLATAAALGLVNGVADGHLVDADAYTWVTRAVDLRTDGQWFDDTLDRVNPPGGLRQHWTRPFDVLLVAGGLLGGPFVGFPAAVFRWAVVVPCLLGVATLWVLWWGFADLLDRTGRIALVLLFGLQLTIVMGFMAGRADHQALMGVLMVAVAGLGRRALGPVRGDAWAVAAGVVSGLALWVGIESAVMVAGITAAVLVQWVVHADASLARLRTYALALAGSAAAALSAEHGGGWITQRQLDELSVTVVVAALLLGLASAVLHLTRDRLASPSRRAAACAGAGAVALALLIAAFPAILDGPLGAIDPLYARTRLRHIGELQPTFGPTLRVTAGVTIPGLSLVPLVIAYLATRRGRLASIVGDGLHVLLLPALAYLVLAATQQRWLFPLNLLLVVPAALGAAHLLRSAGRRAHARRTAVVSVALLAALGWLPFFVLSAPQRSPQCDIDDAITALRNVPTGSTVMSFTDHGPEMLFRTSHSVMSIPNHRDQPGYTATWNAMSATTMTTARGVMTRNAVDLVLVCDNDIETQFYGGDPASFHAQLAAGDPPAWMEPLPTPTAEPRFRLYSVERRG